MGLYSGPAKIKEGGENMKMGAVNQVAPIVQTHKIG